ncbi:hypothetical protein Hypma_010644 [Hypsizygus marmoreus]|uniref:Uncharacterized protein n=1 Tax=Hypsizygus marmoreus TaxID=39966 RepID=A0A369JNW3_HYPMA|nr:hypothetical protein Hypma_010644 [Hypsizygus marmoreus]
MSLRPWMNIVIDVLQLPYLFAGDISHSFFVFFGVQGKNEAWRPNPILPLGLPKKKKLKKGRGNRGLLLPPRNTRSNNLRPAGSQLSRK